MNWRSQKGKSGLIRELMQKGYSVRKAEKAVNAVFDCMAKALARGELVEMPLGTLQAVPRKAPPRRKWQRFRKVNTGEAFFTIVRYNKNDLEIRFRRHRKLKFDDLPVPPPAPPEGPPPPELEQAFQLAQQLTGRGALDTLLRQQLLAAAGHDPARLLRRLRFLAQRGRPNPSAWLLPQEVASLFWI